MTGDSVAGGFKFRRHYAFCVHLQSQIYVLWGGYMKTTKKKFDIRQEARYKIKPCIENITEEM